MSSQALNSKANEVFRERNRAFRILYDTILDLNESDIFSASEMLAKRLRSLARSVGALFLLKNNGHFQVVSADVEGLNVDSFVGIKVNCSLQDFEKQDPTAGLAVKESPQRLLERELRSIDLDTSDWLEYSFPLMQEKKIIGLGLVLINKENKLKMKDMVEVYFLMAQAVLCRILNLEEAKKSHRRFQSLLENSPMGVMVIDVDKSIVEVNVAVEKLIGINKEQLLGQKCFEIFCSKGKDHCPIFDGKMSSVERVDSIRHSEGHEIPIFKTTRPIELDGKTYLIETFFDISDQIKEQKEKEEMQKRLIAVARQAGMAEVATSVLHNIGNALNSINVLVSVLSAEINASRVENCGKAIELLNENVDNLQEYLTEDQRGRHVLSYLSSCSDALVSENISLKKSVYELRTYVEHMVNIVQMQQSVSRTKGFVERANIEDTIDEALSISGQSNIEYGVKISKKIGSIPVAEVDRHKVIQILINLINNAKQSVGSARHDNKVIEILADSRGDGFFEVKVKDSGVGISGDNINKLFTFGFTTKEDGHGFGLHGAALSAKEMGGSLDAFSEGEGMGAIFTLRLPLSISAIHKEATH